MRTPLLSLLSLSAFPALAQCDFVPTITPDQVVLCPNEEMELSTQAYDSYQWFRDGAPIEGATAQTYTVSSATDGGSMITVAATLDACTDTSEGVIVDGWMFLPPYLIHGGDEPYDIGDNGESYFCVGDTMTFELGGATQNITWYDGGSPIPGETGTVLTVTTTGSYTATGAPDVCPNYVMGVGVEVPVIFNPPMMPEIVDLDGQLCPYPTGDSTQWYLDGEPFSTETCIQPDAAGIYTVFVDYGAPCQVVSEPFVITGVRGQAARSFAVRPVPAADGVRISWPTGTPRGTWQLLDMTGRTVRTGGFSGVNVLDLDVRALAPGKYWFIARNDEGWRPMPIAVVR